MYLGELPNMFEYGYIYVDDGNDSDIKSLSEYYPYLGSIPKKKVLELTYKVSKNKEI